MDIAVDPLEGTTLTSKGGPKRTRRRRAGRTRQFPARARHLYGQIAVGGGLPDGVVDLDDARPKNLRKLARAKQCEVSDLMACILDRARHKELVAKVREAGARIMLISDGDITGVVATATPESEIDIYLGSGGAPEGVLAAAALRCIGGQMQGRLMFENDEQSQRVRGWAQRSEPEILPWRRWRRAT